MGLSGRTKEKDTDSLEWRLGPGLDLGLVRYLEVKQSSLAQRPASASLGNL